MSILGFVAELVKALAWPAVAVLTLLLLRRPLVLALERLAKLKFGDWSLEFENESARVAERIGRSNAKALTSNADEDELLKLAEQSPRVAVIEAAIRVETALRRLASKHSQDVDRWPPGQLSRQLSQKGVLDRATVESLQGLFHMRNLVVHATEREVTVQQATEFVTLANAILFVLRTKE